MTDETKKEARRTSPSADLAEEEPVLEGEEHIFEGRVVDLWVQDYCFPHGVRSRLELVRHPGGAAVVALDGQGRVAFVKQYRHATTGWLMEIPAGKLERGESPVACVTREIEEEIGFQAETFDSLGWMWSAPGFSNEKIWLFLARDLKAGSQSLDPDEWLTVTWRDFGEAIADALEGRITDAKSVVGLLRAKRVLEGET